MKKWTEEDSNTAESMLLYGSTYTEIALILNRTVKSVRLKLLRSGFNWDKLHPRQKLFCLKCGKELKVGQRKFCSLSCAAHINLNRIKKVPREKAVKCAICGSNVITTQWTSIIFCDYCKNKKELAKKERRCKNEGCNALVEGQKQYCINCRFEYYTVYRPSCKFQFNVNDYPDKFDLNLVKEYGWYSPVNKNNNPYGVSKDHLLSVKDGFDNNIPPEIISHPANCQLILQKKNSSKNRTSSITYEELLIRIRDF